MKYTILFITCILIFSYNLFAEMPSVIGYGEFSNKSYRDNIYDWLMAKSSNCINRIIIKRGDYTVVPASASAYYTLRLQMHLPLSKITDREEIKEKVKNVKSNVKTTKLQIGIYTSHNDEVPSTPDTVKEWILK